MGDISIFILTMKLSEFKNLIKEVLEEVRLSHRAIDLRHRIQPSEKRCINCGKPAEYNLDGNWVCQTCYPYNKWKTPKSEKIRQKRNRMWMLSQIKDMTREAIEEKCDVNRISNNQVYTGKTSFGGYSHGSTNDYSDVQLERDPLNDPRLTGKKPFKENTFKFKDFNWMKRGDGFGMPIDVYYGTILIGVITTEPGYYEVSLIKGPTKHDDVPIKKDKRNQFKTKELAARAVHLMWKLQRSQPSE